MTAEVVAATLARAVHDSTNQELYWTFGNIEDVFASGERDIIVNLRRPTGALLEDLSIWLLFADSQDSVGPYRLVSEKDGEVTLERFSPHYRGKPEIERVVIRQYPTLRAAWTALLRGEVDAVDRVPPGAVEFVGSDRIETRSELHAYQHLIAFNHQLGLFRSAAVRRALNLAVDRQKLIRSALDGRGLPSTGPLWPRHWAYDGSVTPYAFNPAAAEALLDAAGRPRRGGNPNMRFSFTCLVPDSYRVTEQVAIEVQRQLYAIGVDMQFRAVPPDEYSRLILAGQFEAVLGDFVSGPTFGRPHIFWRSRQSAGRFNAFGYENQEAERLFDLLRSSTDVGVIRSATARLQRVFLNDPPALFLAWSERTLAISRDFEAPQGIDWLQSLWQWKRRDNRSLAAAAP